MSHFSTIYEVNIIMNLQKNIQTDANLNFDYTKKKSFVIPVSHICIHKRSHSREKNYVMNKL